MSGTIHVSINFALRCGDAAPGTEGKPRPMPQQRPFKRDSRRIAVDPQGLTATDLLAFARARSLNLAK